MKSALSLNLRSYWAGLKAVLVCTLAVIVYTALMTGIGALGFPEQANGSMITNSEGQIVGSSLIGQSFSDADGEAIDKYFQPRPSAAGDGYDAAASSGANKGHSDEEYLKTIEERRDAIAEREGVDVKQVPADAATASSSGLDPHISPEYAASRSSVWPKPVAWTSKMSNGSSRSTPPAVVWASSESLWSTSSP